MIQQSETSDAKQRYLPEIMRELGTATSFDDALKRVCRQLSQTLGIERVGVWFFVDDRSAMRCATVYEKSRNAFSSGSMIHAADFPEYFGSLQISPSVPAERAATDPRTSELTDAYLKPLGITSMLDSGIFVNGELSGVLCLEQVGDIRQWTGGDRELAVLTAGLIATRVQTSQADELRVALRKQEERIAELQRNKPLELVAAGVGHDFRNLLTVIRMNAELLQRERGLSASASAKLKSLVEASTQGHSMAVELMEFARPTDRPPAVTDLATVAGEFLRVLEVAVGVDHTISLRVSPPCGPVLIDRGQFTRVLMNLVLNAKEAMPGGGEIAVSLTSKIDEGCFVELAVADTGAGMDEETLSHVFEPFYTKKKTGTGLGLAVVRRAVDRAGGTIAIQSKPGQGTTVRILYPCVGPVLAATK